MKILLKIIKKFNNKILQIINCRKSNKYRKFQKPNMSKIVKCPSCDCHIVVNDQGQKEFCIKDSSD